MTYMEDFPVGASDCDLGLMLVSIKRKCVYLKLVNISKKVIISQAIPLSIGAIRA